MTSKITLKKSSVPGKVPIATDLEYGEIALNYADGVLYYKTSSNVISALGSSTASLNVSGNIEVTGLVDGRDISADGSVLDSLVIALGDIEVALDTINGV